MALRAIFSNSTGSNVDISSRIRAYQLSVSQYAEEGSAAMTQIEVDDPEGGINILGLRPITLSETSESSNQQVIGQYFTVDREITRGPSFRTGASRLWHVNLTDPNSIFRRRIMRGADANRPAETDVQRVQWLLSTTEFGNSVTTSRYVSTSFPVAMDAADYRDQNQEGIIDDCAQASGKNYFIFWDEPVGAYGLFYDFAGSSKFRSSLRLTNVLGLVDNIVTFPVSDTDTKLARDPGRVISGVLLPFQGGEVYVRRPQTDINFYQRDTTAPSVNVKTTAKATARANRYLTDNSIETDVVTTSFKVPLAQVNHLQVGQAVQCWFAHFPGYNTGWNWMRVLTRTVTATSEEWYTVEVELSAAVGGLDAGGGNTSEGLPVPQPPVVSVIPQSCIGGNGLTYDYTQTLTQPPLGFTSFPVGLDVHFHSYATSFMQYWTTGQPSSDYPAPGQDDDLGNGGINGCIYSSGGQDNIGAYVRLTPVGPGTATIVTAPHASGGTGCGVPSTINAAGFISGTNFSVDTDSGNGGDILSITIPNDGHCAHFIDITSSGPWAFVSASWAPL